MTSAALLFRAGLFLGAHACLLAVIIALA